MICAVRNLVLAALWLAPGFSLNGAPKRSAPATGASYVRLDSWARANEFSLQRLERDKVLKLTRRGQSLVFTADSAEAEIDGVHLWLCSPIAYRNGSMRISQRDLSESLAPVLHPPRQTAGLKIKTICLDPGHGGTDPGNQVGKNEEQKFTLLLAFEIREQLKDAGLNVVLTRSADKYVDLSARTALAKQRRADLFVSLHFNSTETSRNRVNGVETYCITPAGAYSTNARGEGSTRWVSGNQHGAKSLLLAFQVQKALVTTLSAEDRGVRRARFQVLREASMPAILVEAGFMSHPLEGRKILDPAYRRRLAQAIVAGIQAYRTAVKG
jgi:N-acetylmuramoyl-L-alanine amidase